MSEILTKHLNCVVCSRGFNSTFKETIDRFPVYHPHLYGDKEYECESRFFDTLLRLYHDLHKAKTSVPLTTVMQSFNWKNQIEMKREMMLWCFAIGYLNVDSLHRLKIPKAAETACTEIFSSYNLDDPESKTMAIEFLRVSLERLGLDLEPVPSDEVPISLSEAKEAHTFYAQMDTKDVKLRSEKQGMATADISGAKEIEQRRKGR